LDEMTPLRALSQAGQKLEKAQIPNAQNEARFILLDVMGTDMAGLLRNGTKPMGEAKLSLYRQKIEQRVSGRPLAYILGKECFMGLWFSVDEHVLIPRRDTEKLVHEALACLSQYAKCRVLDLCCGSGAVGIAIAHLKREAQVIAADISPKCLEVAKKNARQNKVISRMRFVQSDLFAGLSELRFDAIVCNPPYVSDKRMQDLPVDVRDFEPGLALFGGRDGKDYYRAIIPKARHHLNKGGYLVLETANDQAATVAEMMLKAGFQAVCVVRDDGGRPRVVSGRYETPGLR